MKSITPEDTVKFAANSFAAALVLYAECHIVQGLTDYSVIIRYYMSVK